MNKQTQILANISLAFLWIFTGLTSTILNPEFGYNILARTGLSIDYQTFLIWSGGVVDILIGIWLLTNQKIKLCYLAQMVTILVYTLLLTIIDISYWLHPFGPATKNLPILVLIYFLYQIEHSKDNQM